MMKRRSPLSFTINLVIFSAASLPILAQSTPTIESLPNGDYFYGQTSKTNQPGKEYIFLRKSKKTVTGFGYQRNTSYRYCFRGNINANTMIDPTVIEFTDGPAGHKFYQIKSIDLNGFQRLNGSDIQVNGKQRLTECIKLFEKNNKI
ncbi:MULTISPECIES: hypothetical protein [unclassified Microcoleus]|uniref:hypothetical protein n=1 Tax=unclassified Microcoleus TaxID=2642155 RepID=UPI0025E9A10E|nr:MULTISPECIES: hypothetical protein [unclassified Microcoleus]